MRSATFGLLPALRFHALGKPLASCLAIPLLEGLVRDLPFDEKLGKLAPLRLALERHRPILRRGQRSALIRGGGASIAHSMHKPLAFRSCRMIGRGGTRHATVLNPARSNVEAKPVPEALGVRSASRG